MHLLQARTGFTYSGKKVSPVRLFVTPWTVAHHAPLSMGFSRQEYWSGLPCPPPEDLLNPGIEPRSPALQEDSLQAELSGKPNALFIIKNLFAKLDRTLFTITFRRYSKEWFIDSIRIYGVFGEGNGNPLQCSCLENPRDSGTWWAAIYGVAHSQTRLKQFSISSSFG